MINRSRTLEEIRVLIHDYPWHETDFSAPALIEVEQ
jgi:hypothetical protein